MPSYARLTRRALEPNLTLRLAACWQAVGETDMAREELGRLRQAFPNAVFQFSGVDTRLPAASGLTTDADLQWLVAHLGQTGVAFGEGVRDWLTHRGGATRNEACRGDLPLLSPRWDPVQISSDPGVLSAIQSEQEAYRNQQVAPLPMLEPLVVGNVILMRCAEGVQAVDLHSGKLLWPRGNEERGAFQNSGVEGMLWRDAAFGAAATDGRYVFLIDDVSEVPNDVAGGQTAQMMFRGFRGGFFAGGQSGAAPQENHNTLTALDIQWNGALRWRVGGDDGKDCPALANHFFLGPPLAYEGQLYVLAECNGAIRIVSLDPISGQQEWSQELAVVENGIGVDPFRRMAGATPSIDAGVIVCPTSAGGVVALELATRSLLWAYQYPRSRESRLDPQHGYYPKLRQGARWTDASATIAAGRVLLTPLESDEIHCLDLMSGDKLWTQKRGDHLYLACVQNKKVVLVGPKSLTALSLADGSPAWPQPLALPKGAEPTGRGVYSGQRYYLPLSSAKVAEIDLAAGKIVRQAASPRGIVPGNLVWHQGAFISQSASYLEVFDELAALERNTREALAKNPEDAAALVRLAQIELAGETRENVKPLASAIAHLRQAYAISPAPRTRSLLITSLLEGVRRKLTNARELSDALDDLIE